MNKPSFPFKKRVSPDEEENVVKQVQEEKQEIKEESTAPVKKEVQVKQETPKVVKTNKKSHAPVLNAGSNIREKYTAMMDKELRIRLKIASVRLGIDVSKYIEEAVLEKLERDGAE